MDMNDTLSTIKKVRFLLPDAKEDMDDLESTIQMLTDAYEGNLRDISQVNRLLYDKVKNLTDELSDTRKQLNELEKNILQYNQHHPCGMINRRYFDYYMISATDRPATDEEWARFLKEFTFNTDKLNTAIYKWIEKVTGVPQGMP